MDFVHKTIDCFYSLSVKLQVCIDLIDKQIQTPTQPQSIMCEESRIRWKSVDHKL